jgi:hypothetical protein
LEQISRCVKDIEIHTNGGRKISNQSMVEELRDIVGREDFDRIQTLLGGRLLCASYAAALDKNIEMQKNPTSLRY